MGFDPTTARPVSAFDPTTAQALPAAPVAGPPRVSTPAPQAPPQPESFWGDIGNGLQKAGNDVAQAFLNPANIGNTGMLAASGVQALGDVTQGVTHAISGPAASAMMQNGLGFTSQPTLQRVGGLIGGKTIVRPNNPATLAATRSGVENGMNLATLFVPGGDAGDVAGMVSAEPKLANPAARIANKMLGGRLLNPQNQARAMVMNNLAKDGATPQNVSGILNDWQATGASPPTMLDAASALPSGGENVRALARGAAVNNPSARGVISTYRGGLEANLQDNAQNLAQGLNADPRSTPQFIADTQAAQRADANTTYAPAYAQPIDLTKPAMAALSDAPGNAALLQSRASAVANQRWDQVADIDKLLGGQDQNFNWTFRDPGAVSPDTPAPMYGPLPPRLAPVPQVSGGTLDRARIAMREMASGAAQAGNNDMAAGLYGRVNDIDSALDAAPGLQDARAQYGNQAAQMNAAQFGNDKILSALPQDYTAGIGDINAGVRPVGQTPAASGLNDVQNALQIGARNRIVGEIGRPAEGATGLLNRLSGSNNMSAKLAQTFGPDTSANFQAGIGNEVARVDNARAVDPTFGSKTAVNAHDGADAGALIGLIHDPVKTVALTALQKLAKGITTTAAENQAIAEMLTQQVTPASLVPRLRPATAPPVPVLAGSPYLGSSLPANIATAAAAPPRKVSRTGQ